MKRESSFTNALSILEVLKKHSSEDNGLTASQIKKLVNQEGGGTLISKTETVSIILGRLADREFLGYSVDETGTGRRKYYLERMFTPTEAIAVINLIHSARSLTKKQSDEMVSKIKGTLSDTQRQLLNSRVIFTEGFKTSSYDTLLNIEVISNALKDNRLLSFYYCRYNNEKQLVKDDKHWVTVPYYIVPLGGNYYLLAKARDENFVRTLRIDKIADAEATDDKPTEGEMLDRKHYNVAERVKKSTFMHIGDNIETIVIKCNEKQQNIRSAVIENYPDAKITGGDGEGGFTATFRAEVSGFVYWALQYCVACEVISPAHVREEVRGLLLDACRRYG
jgi:predicted DNA-binding transcriptional regulator YafY